MTRSRTRNNPNQFEPIPFPMRALKYLLTEIQNAENQANEASGSVNGGAPDGLEEDDRAEDWEDDDPLSTGGTGEKGEMAFLSGKRRRCSEARDCF